MSQNTTPSYQISAPEPFDVNNPEKWPVWKQRFERFRCATKLHEEDGVTQVNTLIYLMGSDAEEILKSFGLKSDQLANFEAVVNRFEKHFVMRRNGTYERAKFLQRMQGEDESVDSFVTALYSLSEHCEYGKLRDTMICDKIIHGLKDAKLAEQLQLDTDLTLQKAVSKARQSETVRKQQSTVRSGTAAQIEEIERIHTQKQKYWKDGKVRDNNKNIEKCKQCNKNKYNKHECPAKNAVCNKCGYKGHYAVCCKTKKKIIKCITEEEEENTPFLGLVKADINKQDDNWNISIKILHKLVKFKIDTGADVTVIPKKLVDELKLKMIPNQSKKLLGPADQKLKVIGQCDVEMQTERKTSRQVVYVLKQLREPLLGKPAIHDLGLISRICSISNEVKEKYPKLFKGLGTMEGEYKIKLLPNIVPHVVATSRRIAIPLREKVKNELEEMERQGVIRKVDEPTTWCSGMVVVPKKNGTVRICVDLIPLNKAVMREFYTLPSVDESLAQIADSKYFSKLDARSGFWQVKLAEESQLLTTFITPFGRYCFQRLPFGISSAPEFYQKRMSQIISGLGGVICHADDILIHGKTKSEHDENLYAVLNKLERNGITLNDKCIFGVEEIEFLGHIINKQGIKPDPKKVTAITEMRAPTNITELRRFNGMVQYIAKFVPHLSTIAQPLNQLLKENNEWIWGGLQEEAFNKIKSIITSEPTLLKYDPNKPTRVTTDASAYGIGGVLEQQSGKYWKPVIYVSRSLTKTERLYAQIEKECLGITWTCEKLREYITGKEIEIITDNQPLVTILGKKGLDELTPRLQRMRMKLMGFSFTIRHVSGKLIHTADLMSRIPKIDNETEGNDILCNEIDEYVNSIDLMDLPISDKQLRKIKEEQRKDITLKNVIEAVKNGWDTIPDICRSYYGEREDFTIHQGILVKKLRIVIPKSMQKEMLERIHEGHMGINKCRERAKETIWWPGISSQIKALVKSCEECCEQRINSPETLKTTNLPSRAWQVIAMDLFKLNGKTYLAMIDYYSKYLEIIYLERTTAVYIIQRIKAVFARYGVPEVVRTDNGTQFIAEDLNTFKQKYGFEIITNSPKHSQSNGQAEAAVKIAKNILKKNKDPNLALLEYRNTPIVKGFSPAELFFGRKLRTPLPRLPNLLNPKPINTEQYNEIQRGRKQLQEKYFNKRHKARDLTPLHKGERVWITDLKRWGIVQNINPNIPRSYHIVTNKRPVCRNRKFLISCPETSQKICSRPERIQYESTEDEDRSDDCKEDEERSSDNRSSDNKEDEDQPDDRGEEERLGVNNKEHGQKETQFTLEQPKSNTEIFPRRSQRSRRLVKKLNL